MRNARLYINGKFLADVVKLEGEFMTPTPEPVRYVGGKPVGPDGKVEGRKQTVFSGIVMSAITQVTSTPILQPVTTFQVETEISKSETVQAIDNTDQRWRAGDTIWWGEKSVFVVARHTQNKAVELPRYHP